jgi:hypothetical protein
MYIICFIEAPEAQTPNAPIQEENHAESDDKKSDIGVKNPANETSIIPKVESYLVYPFVALDTFLEECIRYSSLHDFMHTLLSETFDATLYRRCTDVLSTYDNKDVAIDALSTFFRRLSDVQATLH